MRDQVFKKDPLEPVGFRSQSVSTSVFSRSSDHSGAPSAALNRDLDALGDGVNETLSVVNALASRVAELEGTG